MMERQLTGPGPDKTEGCQVAKPRGMERLPW